MIKACLNSPLKERSGPETQMSLNRAMEQK